MKKFTACFLTLAAVAGGASLAAADVSTGTKAPSRLAVVAKFSPNPPKRGLETIVISIQDALGKPVKGASVKVASNMPAMSMGGPSLAAKDNGDGTYSATFNVNFATKWTFDVAASAGKRQGTAHLSADVK